MTTTVATPLQALSWTQSGTVDQPATTLTSPPRPGGLPARLRWLNSSIDRIHKDLNDTAQIVTRDDITGIDKVIRRLEATKLALIAKADRQHAATTTAHSSTAAWVASATGTSGATATAHLRLAHALETDLPATHAAFTNGDLSPAAASIIADTITKLPTNLTSTERAAVEEHLVRDAHHLNPGQLRKAATLALSATQRSPVEVAQHQENLLLDQERRAYATATLTWHDHSNGTTTGRFTIPTGAAHVLRKIIQSMTAPRRNHLNTPSVTSDSALARHRDDDWDTLTWEAKAGRAFTTILEHLPTDALTSKVASTIIVTMTLDQLRDTTDTTTTTLTPTVGAAPCDTGHHHSTTEARRLACQAGIIPLVLGGPSLPLDLGRQQRLFTDHQRTALAAIYTECAATDCDRPYSWTELHHQHPYTTGGPTNLHNAIPLCSHHHRKIHDPQYTHHIHTTPTGHKTITYTRRT